MIKKSIRCTTVESRFKEHIYCRKLLLKSAIVIRVLRVRREFCPRSKSTGLKSYAQESSSVN